MNLSEQIASQPAGLCQESYETYENGETVNENGDQSGLRVGSSPIAHSRGRGSAAIVNRAVDRR